MTLPVVGTVTSAAWGGAYPYDAQLSHDATGAEYLLVFASSGGGYAWDPKAYYAGVEMTLLDRSTAAGGQGTIWVFGLAAPASGANTVRVTRRAAIDGGTSATTEYGDQGATTAFNLTDLDATTPIGPIEALHGGTSVSPSVVTTIADSLVLGLAHNYHTTNQGITSTQGTRFLNSSLNTNHEHFGWEIETATPGTYGSTFTVPFNTVGAVLVTLQPPAGGGGTGTAYTMAAAAGSFALSGQAASLKARRKLVAQARSSALTGRAATLKAQRKLLAAAGSLALAGQPAQLTAQRRLTAQAGAFDLIGQPVTLTKQGLTHYSLAADAGLYALTGQDAGGRIAYRLAAQPGAYLLAGQDAGLSADWRLQAAAGAVTLEGQTVSFALGTPAGYTLGALGGSFAAAGGDVTFRRTYRLPADPAAFTLVGQDVGALRTYRLPADPATFTLTGQDADALRAYRMAAAPGSFALEDLDALLAVQTLNHYTLSAEPGSFALTGLPVADPPVATPYGLVFTGDAATSFAQTATALKAGMPFSISLWAQTANLAQSGAVLAFMGRTESNTAYFALSLNGDKLRIEARAGATTRAVDTLNAISADTSFHALGVFASSTDRRAYLDGDDANKGAGSGSASPLSATGFALGARRKLSPDGGFAGAIAHVAVWGVALGAAEAAALAAGAWPPDVAPESLLAFYPLDGEDPEADLQGLGPDLALTGTTVGAFVPPVTMPAGEDPPPVVDGEVTTETSLGSYYLWSTISGSWDDLPAAKAWDSSAPSEYTATVARSLGFAASRPKTVERLTARTLALAAGAARSVSKVLARALDFAETVTDLVAWTNLISESFLLTALRPKTIQPAAAAESLALGTARRAETTKALAEAVGFVTAISRAASFERRHLRDLAIAGTSAREFQLTLAQTLSLAELTLDNAGVILHDLVVRGQPMSLAEFRAFVARGPLGYTAKETLVPGDYRYREAIVGVSVRAAATGGVSGILGLTLHVDVEDVRDRGEATLPAAASQVIAFNKTFHVPPEVYTQTRAGASPFYADIESISTTGMTVTLRQVSSPSTIVAGTITWSATGW